jgi:hypothetical protein
LVVIGSALRTAYRALRRLDPVAVIERGRLTLEEEAGSAGRPRPQDAPRPLAPLTYYRRHSRQAGTLILSALLLILGTGLLFLLFAAGADAMQPGLNVFRRVSAVSPNQGELDPDLVSRIRSNPDVERVIRAFAFSPVKISIPPMFPSQPVETLCVDAEDLAYLVDLYGLRLAEGRLPRPGTNEVVISWAAAKNRGLQVGEVLGDPERPAYPGAPALPVPILVSGIFAPAADLDGETWLSFMSLEFVDPFRPSGLSLIVVPGAGRKEPVDAWLEDQAAGGGRIALTYRNQQAALRKEMGSMLATFILMEIVIALVAALALAGLHYLFVAGRSDELGILNALGFSRRQLAGRILRELFFLVGAAWLAGVAGCYLILAFLRQGLFARAGLMVNPANPVPWTATALVPLAVLAAGTIVTARLFSKLDPISAVERRD